MSCTRANFKKCATHTRALIKSFTNYYYNHFFFRMFLTSRCVIFVKILSRASFFFERFFLPWAITEYATKNSDKICDQKGNARCAQFFFALQKWASPKKCSLCINARDETAIPSEIVAELSFAKPKNAMQRRGKENADGFSVFTWILSTYYNLPRRETANVPSAFLSRRTRLKSPQRAFRIAEMCVYTGSK